MRGLGYKATPQRLSVVRTMADEQHLSVDEIQERCPEVGIVTIYRTLDLLCELGLARRLDLGDGKPRYELAEDHHHHLICQSCGTISEFEDCPLEQSELPHEAVGFEVNFHRLEVYGLCGACKD
jgi:Fur family transcriptional regulator, ferric uptake regulator